MNEIITKKTNWDEMQELLTAYFSELGYKNDGFHNCMLLDGDAYLIFENNENLGFFSLGNSWDNGKMLRGFYVCPDSRNKTIEIFQKVVEITQIEAALVASNDSLFLSLVFEKMNALKTRFDMQAFNFTYGEPKRPAEYGMECVVELKSNELQEMERLTEGQWEGCFDDPDFTFYAIQSEGEVLGYGAIGKMKYNVRNVDVGNFTLPQNRKKGVGRSLIINLSNIAISKGYMPVAGCWYGNRNSIATLKSSGFKPENRIFYVRFQ